MTGLLLGAHMSVAGGLHKAIERIRSVDGTALQIFTRNQRQWNATPVSDAEAQAWRAAWSQWGPYPVASHASYLINLANPDPDKAERSIAATADELLRCALLEIPFVVMHPGSHLGLGEAAGLSTFTANLDRAFVRAEPTGRDVGVLLETTSGQGTNLGADFAHFSAIMERSAHADRLGVCLDTCHIFAAGYDLRTPAALDATLADLDRHAGLDRLRFVHLNDSKTPLGSRKDRHAHIGQGEIGLSGFAALMNDPRMARLPLVLETDKEDDLADDVRNMNVLRSLVR
ncbi:MAG: deoxyribonuclease IV [Desulfovibrio sp.]